MGGLSWGLDEYELIRSASSGNRLVCYVGFKFKHHHYGHRLECRAVRASETLAFLPFCYTVDIRGLYVLLKIAAFLPLIQVGISCPMAS